MPFYGVAYGKPCLKASFYEPDFKNGQPSICLSFIVQPIMPLSPVISGEVLPTSFI